MSNDSDSEDVRSLFGESSDSETEQTLPSVSKHRPSLALPAFFSSAPSQRTFQNVGTIALPVSPHISEHLSQTPPLMSAGSSSSSSKQNESQHKTPTLKRPYPTSSSSTFPAVNRPAKRLKPSRPSNSSLPLNAALSFEDRIAYSLTLDIGFCDALRAYAICIVAPALPVPLPSLRSTKSKRRRVPANAQNWDVPFPFAKGEAPPGYVEDWVASRKAVLVGRINELLRQAISKAEVWRRAQMEMNPLVGSENLGEVVWKLHAWLKKSLEDVSRAVYTDCQRFGEETASQLPPLLLNDLHPPLEIPDIQRALETETSLSGISPTSPLPYSPSPSSAFEPLQLDNRFSAVTPALSENHSTASSSTSFSPSPEPFSLPTASNEAFAKDDSVFNTDDHHSSMLDAALGGLESEDLWRTLFGTRIGDDILPDSPMSMNLTPLVCPPPTGPQPELNPTSTDNSLASQLRTPVLAFIPPSLMPIAPATSEISTDPPSRIIASTPTNVSESLPSQSPSSVEAVRMRAIAAREKLMKELVAVDRQLWACSIEEGVLYSLEDVLQPCSSFNPP